MIVDLFQLTLPPSATSCYDWAQYHSPDGAKKSHNGKRYHRYQMILDRLVKADAILNL